MRTKETQPQDAAPVEDWAREAVASLSAIDPSVDAASRWGRRELLVALDRVFDGALNGASDEASEGFAGPPESEATLARAAGLALAEVLHRELTLDWTSDDGEPALRFGGSEVVLYPIRMVKAHLAGARRDGTPVRLERLLASTAGYLDHLVRYFPSRLGLERRSRGSRRSGERPA